MEPLSAGWILSLLVTAVISGLVGGGAFARFGYRGLKDLLIGDLKEIFAKRSDLNALGSRVNGLETVAVEARTAGDANAAEIATLKASGAHTFDRMEQLLIRLEKSHERLFERQERQDAVLNRTVATLDALEKRLDRHSRRESD